MRYKREPPPIPLPYDKPSRSGTGRESKPSKATTQNEQKRIRNYVADRFRVQTVRAQPRVKKKDGGSNIKSINGKEMIANGTCYDRKVTSFVDTGSSVSLVSSSFLDYLGVTDRVSPTQAKLTSFSQNIVPAMGEIRLRSELAGLTTEWTFIVSNLLDTDFLIGADFMKANDISLDMGKGILKTARGQTSLSNIPGQLRSSVKIKCKRTHTIPPNTVHYILGGIPNQNLNIDGLVQPSNELTGTTGIMIAPSMVKVGKKGIPIECLNLSDKAVTIKQNQILGLLCPHSSINRISGVKINRLENDDCSINNIPQTGSLKWTQEKLFEELNINQLDISEEQASRMKEIVWKYKDCFSINDQDLGNCNFFEGKIQLKENAEPKWIPSGKTPYKLQPELDKHIAELIEADVIEPCKTHSSWNSRVFLVPKPNRPSQFRFVADLRGLNSQCLPDSYELPNVNHVADCIGGNKLYSTLDLSQSFHQISYEESSKPLTAFSNRGMRYWYKRMVMGQCSSSSQFARMMNKLLTNIPIRNLIYFLDDLLIASNDVNTHLDRIEAVLKRFKDANLKLKPKKCSFLQKQVKFVGLTISEEGMQVNEDRVKALLELKAPTTRKETQSILGFFGYNRRFIKHYAAMSKPLYQLLNKGTRFKWTAACEESFQKLREGLKNSTILSMPDVEDPLKSYEVTVDGSQDGYGATLTQMIRGERRTVAYYSKGVQQHKKQWGQTKLEFETMCRALDHWRVYLQGTEFKVITDCGNLLELETIFGKNNPTLHRKIQRLANFIFTIQHISGEENHIADFLSRYPYKRKYVDNHTQTEQCNEQTAEPSKINTLQAELEKATEMLIPADFFRNTAVNNHNTPAELQLGINQPVETEIPRCCCNEEKLRRLNESRDEEVKPPVKICSISDVIHEKITPIAQDLVMIKKAQEEDDIVKEVKEWIIRGEKPDTIQALRAPDQLISYWKTFNLLSLQNGIVMRLWAGIKNEEDRYLIIVPQSLQHNTMLLYHSTLMSAHPGVDKSINLCRRQYYWPKMKDDFSLFIGACQTCGRCKQPQAYLRGPLKHIMAHAFNDIIIIDHIVPSATKTTGRGMRYILTITDVWSGYVVAVATSQQTGVANYKAIMKNWVLRHGCCREIILDNAPGFREEFFNAIFKAFGCKITFGLPYSSASTGKAERSNKRVNTALRTSLPEGKENQWDLYLDYITFALNCLKNRHTGFSANKLVFGRELNSPLSILIENEELEPSSYNDKAYQLHRTIKDIVRKVRINSELDFKYSEKSYNSKVKGPFFKEGQYCYVLVNCPAHKFSIRWRGPFKVQKALSDHLYVVLINNDVNQEKVINISKMKRHTGSLSNLNPNSNTFIPNLDLETTFIPNQVLVPDPSIAVDDSPVEESEPQAHHINNPSDQTVEVHHAEQIQQSPVANNDPTNQVTEQERPEPIIESQEVTPQSIFDHDLDESELGELLGDSILEEASTNRTSGRRTRRPVLYNETALSRKAWADAQEIRNC